KLGGGQKRTSSACRSQVPAKIASTRIAASAAACQDRVMGALQPCDGETVQLRPFAGDADFPRMVEVANASFAADGIAMVRTVEVMRADYAAMSSFDPARSIVMADIGERLVGEAGHRRRTRSCAA